MHGTVLINGRHELGRYAAGRCEQWCEPPKTIYPRSIRELIEVMMNAQVRVSTFAQVMPLYNPAIIHHAPLSNYKMPGEGQHIPIVVTRAKNIAGKGNSK